MDPINYGQDVQTPFQAALQGYSSGAAIRNDQLARQQQEAALKAQQQMQTDLAGLASNPTPQAIAQMSVRYPQLSEQFKRSHDMLSTEQQAGRIDHMTQVYAAAQNGRPDVAATLLKDRAAAMRNSGNEKDAKAAETMAEWATAHPDSFKTTAGLMLSSAMGPDKFATTFATLGDQGRAAAKAPADLAKAEADAAKAGSEAKTSAVTAKYADSTAIADLEKKGWDVKKIVADIDIAKQGNRIAAMNAQTSRINSDTQRQELGLKITEAKRKLDETIREKTSEAESAKTAIDNSLNTIERLKKNKGLNDVLGPFEGKKYYPNSLASMTPFNSSAEERSDAIALIETLGSQAFLAQVPTMKGLGALSNAEGEKLQSALTNLNRTQSEQQFRANLDDARRLILKARDNVKTRYGIPDSKPDTPAAPGTRPPLSSFQR